MRTARLLRIAAIAALACGLPVVAIAQSSANFALSQGDLNAGVGNTASANYALSSSLGDPFFTGRSDSANYELRHGLFDVVPSAGQVLSVTLAGAGTGTVTSAPPGIACPGTCSSSFATSSTVTLSAAANPGSVFAGWSGACSGAGSCMVTMAAAESVTATFAIAGATPVTTITGHPSNPSNIGGPQFTFTSDQPGSTFQCRLDGGAFYPCSSPTTVHVGNGTHTFTVEAIGPTGIVDPVGASYTWLVQGVSGRGPGPGGVNAIPALDDWAIALLSLALLIAAGFGNRLRRYRRRS